MKMKPYIKPESIVVSYYDPLMGFSGASTGTEESFAKEHDVFFDEGNDERETLWDFTPFEEENGGEQ